jgi:hypothetical protein
MGASVRMIEKHYGTLIDGAHAEIAAASTRWKPVSPTPPMRPPTPDGDRLADE